MVQKIDASQRLKRFLEAGFFPEELPPPFVSGTFARFRKSLWEEWEKLPKDDKRLISSPEAYGVPQYGHARRRIVIVNPINHFRVSKILSDNWVSITKFLKNSEISEFRPIIDLKGDRSLFDIDWAGVSEAKVRISARYATQFHSDISKFYGSVYTHSVAWAYFGKEKVQTSLYSKWYKQSFLKSLDEAIRHGQRNQSIGIPIGPDTSRVVSEMVAVGIERELKVDIKDLDTRGVRYVDDITVGLDETESEDRIVSAYERALSRFELDVNFQKTKIISRKTDAESHWRYEMIRISAGPRIGERDRLDSYFGLAVKLADKAEKDAVLKWAIKASRSLNVSDKNYSYYIEWLISVTRRAPACLRALSQLMIDGRHNGRPLPIDSIRKFIVDLIATHASVGHAFEVSWALFLSKGLSIRLKRSEVKEVFKMRSSVCALLSMDLNSRGLIEGGIDDSFWKKSCAKTSGLETDLWLLSYEAEKKGWWSGSPAPYVKDHPLFGPLKSKGIYFYDERKNVPTTKKEAKKASIHKFLSNLIFNRIDDYF